MLVFALAVVGSVRVPAALGTGFTFLIPAWWFLDLALRKRWLIRVHTLTGSRKVVFHVTRDRREIEQFVMKAKSQFGYA
ncbi:MAG TPA: hypothetical protein VM733_03890 [Thermoanaerobaculia bacterium]|nr:hypothetical protein [Thermoanaerobaculia bacterium]